MVKASPPLTPRTQPHPLDNHDEGSMFKQFQSPGLNNREFKVQSRTQGTYLLNRVVHFRAHDATLNLHNITVIIYYQLDFITYLVSGL